MPTLDWLNRAHAFTTAAQVPYRLLENVSTHGEPASAQGNLLIQGDNLEALKAAGKALIYTTHYMEEAAQADRVLVMSKGNVVMEGTPKEVFSQTEKVRSLHLDVPQAAELRDELVKAGIPMREGIIDTGACAQALYELLQ